MLESGIDVTSFKVDYALIPSCGHYTLGPTNALNFLKKFKSGEKVIPILYDDSSDTKGEFE